MNYNELYEMFGVEHDHFLNLEAARNSILDTSIFDASSISIPDVSAPDFDSSPVSVDSSASVDCSF
ncbi:hypothetical protein [Vibrio metschnikovii]|uniref:Uncharacterized protein n=1 Tax=Vibrio metschnikovii TaxID=28172 RepID=A0A9X0REJ6_VIBME|nr:hypothetical protein [Vibrio metschnikovii]MBC5853110.1 hypothetical protein [Vibrio metschnikovii]